MEQVGTIDFDKIISDLKLRIDKFENKKQHSNFESQLELAKTYKDFAEIRFRQSHYDEAQQLFHQAFLVFNKIDDQQGIIACKNADASISLAKGELPVAKIKLEKLLEHLKSNPSKAYEHIILNNLGIVYDKSGDLARAVLYYHRSLALKKELDKPILPTYTLHNLANIYYQVEDYDTSFKYNKLALETLVDSTDLNAQATIFNGIAQTLSKKGRYIKAKEYFTKAKKLAMSVNNRGQIAEALTGLGYLEFINTDLEKAEKLIEESLKTYQKLEEQEYIVKCLIHLAQINRNRNIDKALKQIKQAKKLCKINGYRSLLAKVYKITAQLKEANKNFSKAYKYHQKYVELYIETNKINILNQVEVNRLSIELESAESQKIRFQEKAQNLEHESTHDHLTGACNRREMDRTLSERWIQAPKQLNPNHLVMLDIDDFKHVNDNFSHEIGDKVLQAITSLIKTSLNENDRLFRYGGEEFTILLYNCLRTEATQLFNEIRANIEDFNWQTIAPSLKITATLGMVSASEQESIDKALHVADERMYKGKKSGKNVLVVE